MIVRGKESVAEPRIISAPTAPAAPVRPCFEPREVARPSVRFTGPVAAAAKAEPVSFDDLSALAGKPAFLRIARRDGRSEIVAGELLRVSSDKLTFATFDVASAQALATPGDDFHIHTLGGDRTVTLLPGDAVTTAVGLPLAVLGRPQSGSRRIDLRARAQEYVDGKERPGLCPMTIDAHLVRDEAGAPYRSPANRPVITASAAADLKAEQNAIVMALAGPLTRMFYDAARLGALGEAYASHRPLWTLFENLDQLATQTTTRFTASLDAASPLGRAWSRLKTVHELAQSHLPQAVVSGTPNLLLKQGMITPVSVLTRLTEVAETFAASSGLKPSEIIRSSPALVLKLAATHQRILESVETELVGNRHDESYDPEHFELVDGRLELKAEFLEKLETTRGIRFSALPSRTTGCPAAQTFNGANPVREFVQMYAELLEKLEARRA